MIFVVLFFALVIRLIFINQSLWLDEAIQILAVRNFSYQSLIVQYSIGDFHPPLYHLILKFWTSIFGFSEINTRLLSVLFGVGTVWVVYLIGKQLAGKTLGILSALFLAVAPLHIYYSQEARMYAAAAFFVSLSVFTFLRLIKNGSFFNWSFFFISSLLFFYTDYLPWLMVIPFNLWVFWQRKNLGKSWVIRWLVIQLGLLVFLLPWFPFLARQLAVGHAASQAAPLWGQTVGGFTFKALPLTFAKFIFGRISFDNKVIYGLVFLLSFSFFTLLILKNFTKLSKERVLLFLWLILPIILGWILSLFLPVYSYFRFLFVLPAMYILIAWGVELFKPSKTKIKIIIAVLIFSLASQIYFWLSPRFHREDWRGAVSWIEEKAGDTNSGTVFVTIYQTAPYNYYAPKVPFYGPDGWQTENLKQIFLMRYVQPIFDPKDLLRQEIEESGYRKVEEKDFNGVTIWYYRL